MPGLERVGRMLRQTRAFVDVEPDAVTGAMEETLDAAFDPAGLVAFAMEELDDALVDIAGRGVVPEGFEPDFLGAFDGVIKLAYLLAGAAAHDRAGDVA